MLCLKNSFLNFYFSDYAKCWIPWPCILLDPVEPCRFAGDGGFVHGLQPGCFAFWSVLSKSSCSYEKTYNIYFDMLPWIGNRCILSIRSIFKPSRYRPAIFCECFLLRVIWRYKVPLVWLLAILVSFWKELEIYAMICLGSVTRSIKHSWSASRCLWDSGYRLYLATRLVPLLPILYPKNF